jgi:hypothetical protein
MNLGIWIALAGAILLHGTTLRAAAPRDESPQDAAPQKAAPQDESPQDAAGVEFFEKKIRPLLVERCFECHGGDHHKGGLSLVSRKRALAGGDSGEAITPGEPKESLLIEAISYDPDGYQMPPKGKLPQGEIALLTRWVQMGAPWPDSDDMPATSPGAESEHGSREDHWAYQPPAQSMSLPPVNDEAWIRTPVDRFILANLEKAGLRPAREAPRTVWLRRVSFDLTGLPPTPQQIEDFLTDTRPDAYERVVERLLASPQYGERWGRHWLDLVRYAETLGHEFDYDLYHAWRYRDYVVRAFNADLPYDQFVVEHLAGDLLSEPRRHPEAGFNESILGTGFFYLCEGSHSPVDVRQQQADRIDNQIDVFGKAFLGQTLACARCHDHKFDPILASDYYALAGYLKSSRYQQAFCDPPQRIQQRVEQLRALRKALATQLRRELDTPWNGQCAQAAAYLKASHEVLFGTPPESGDGASPSDRESIPPVEVVFEDFEGDTYQGWEVSGTAFGAGPQRLPLPSYQGDVGALGKGLVNSHNVRAMKTNDGPAQGDADTAGVRGGDDHLGRMVSRPFKVSHRYIHFLVGGGAHQNKTCVNLRIGDEVVLSATGRNNNRMLPHRFDVGPWAGKEARLEIVDQHRGGWGNIGVDHIVFSDRAVVFDGDAPSSPRRSVENVAAEMHLDARLLARWVEAVRVPELSGVEHPLVAWKTLADGTAGESAEAFSAARQRLAQAIQQRNSAVASAAATSVLFEDFSTGSYDDPLDGWFVTGDAFGPGPTTGGELRLGSDSNVPLEGLLPANLAYSGAVSRAAEGVLRSQSFTIEHDYIHFRAAGRGSRLNLVVDGLTLIRDPIYGGLTKSLDDDKLAWHTMKVGMWKGHRAHLELIDSPLPNPTHTLPAEVLEQRTTDGYLAVDVIRFSNDSAAGPQAPSRLAQGLVQADGPDDLDRLAGAYQRAITAAVQSWLKSDPDTNPDAGANSQADANILTDADPLANNDQITLLNWLLQHDLLPVEVLQQVGEGDTNSDPLPSRRWRALWDEIQQVERSIPAPMRALAVCDGTGEDERVFIRGNYRVLGDAASRGLPEAICDADQPRPAHGSGRLELAQRMIAPDNPLLARVMVNRIWQHHFGRGIVASPDNFGLMGRRPTHPELMDYLATQFVQQGWSIKAMHRLCVLSSTYRMASQADLEAEAQDATNQLWHRMPIRRLEAEAIRDAVLAVSGRLDLTLGGPPVPIYLTPDMRGAARPKQAGPLDGAGRRSIYLNVRRNFLVPMLMAFDFPSPLTTIGRRGTSNTPSQALVMMNNPFILEQAKLWATRLLAQEDQTTEARIQAMYLTALGREPRPSELQAATQFLSQFNGDGDPQTAGLEAWTELCHVLFNVNEFVFIN